MGYATSQTHDGNIGTYGYTAEQCYMAPTPRRDKGAIQRENKLLPLNMPYLGFTDYTNGSNDQWMICNTRHLLFKFSGYTPLNLFTNT